MKALHLAVKQPVQLGRSTEGLNFCGFRILPGRLPLSRRRRRRDTVLRRQAERGWLDGLLIAQGLQPAYAAALALTLPANAAGWRREQLRRQKLEPALAAL